MMLFSFVACFYNVTSIEANFVGSYVDVAISNNVP